MDHAKDTQPAWHEHSTQFGEMTLEEVRSTQAKFSIARDWTKHHSPRNVLLALVGEVGELAEIFQWKGELQHGAPELNDREREHLGEELSDVLIYLTRLADVTGVNLADAVKRKFEKNAVKYPEPNESSNGGKV